MCREPDFFHQSWRASAVFSRDPELAISVVVLDATPRRQAGVADDSMAVVVVSISSRSRWAMKSTRLACLVALGHSDTNGEVEQRAGKGDPQSKSLWRETVYFD